MLIVFIVSFNSVLDSNILDSQNSALYTLNSNLITLYSALSTLNSEIASYGGSCVMVAWKTVDLQDRVQFSATALNSLEFSALSSVHHHR